MSLVTPIYNQVNELQMTTAAKEIKIIANRKEKSMKIIFGNRRRILK